MPTRSDLAPTPREQAEPAEDEETVDVDAMMQAVDPPLADRARGIASLHGVPAVAVFVCGRRRRQHPCASCGKASVALCDYPLTGKAKGRTCDRPMCVDCRRPQPKKGPTVDYCRVHDAVDKTG